MSAPPIEPADTATATPGARTADLLRLTGRLFAAYWPALFFWFLLQHVLHRPLMAASVQLGLLNRPLGFFGLAVLVVVQLLCTIAMFQALRSGMTALTHASADAETPWAARTRLTDAIAVALLPFFAYYATWGLLRDEVAQYSVEILRNIAGLGLPGPQDILKAPGLWISIAATWLVRRASLARHAKTHSPVWSIAATICEAYWLFLGVLAISSWKQWPWDWWHRREVYAAYQTWWNDPRDVLAGVKQWVGPALALGQAAIGVAILPLVWLTIAAVVYGHDLRQTSTALPPPHARVEHLQRRYAGLPIVVRRAAEHWSGGWRKKATPIVNSLRLLLRAGLRPALALCVCYIALEFVCSWAFRGAVTLIGPHARETWGLILGPLVLLVGDASGQTRSLLQEPLRICLLAAAFELALREVRRTRVAAPAPVPASDAGGAAASEPVSA